MVLSLARISLCLIFTSLSVGKGAVIGAVSVAFQFLSVRPIVAYIANNSRTKLAYEFQGQNQGHQAH